MALHMLWDLHESLTVKLAINKRLKSDVCLEEDHIIKSAILNCAGKVKPVHAPYPAQLQCTGEHPCPRAGSSLLTGFLGSVPTKYSK